jgi:hypothetical protein
VYTENLMRHHVVLRFAVACIGVLLLNSAADLSACAMPDPCHDASEPCHDASEPCHDASEPCHAGTVITCCAVEQVDDPSADGPSAQFRVRRDTVTGLSVTPPSVDHLVPRGFTRSVGPVHGYRSVDVATLVSALLI